MCYDVQALTKLKEIYAQRRTSDIAQKQAIEIQFEQLELKPLFHASGFSHPNLLVFTDEAPLTPQLFHWGLIPFWVKDEAKGKILSNKTLNARGETIFEKPAFRAAAKSRRCLVMIDAFYEHRHFNGKTYAYRIQLKDDQPMVLAGLWEVWYKGDSPLYSFSIVTTKANPLMAQIHNNPKLAEPRMPVILPEGIEEQWLQPIQEKADQELVQQLIHPYPHSELTYHTVGKLRGKAAVGNQKEVLNNIDYPELEPIAM